MPMSVDNKVYAGFFVRLIAFIIDSVIAAIIVGFVKIPMGLVATAGADFLKSNFIFQFSLIDVVGYLGVVAYFTLLTYFAHTTLGKMLLRLEVVSGSGEWTFINVFYRETVGRFLSSILNIGYLAVLVTAKKQGFHDMLCDTMVVYKNMQTMTNNIIDADVFGKEDVIEDTMDEQIAELAEQSIVENGNVPIVHESVPEDVPTYHYE